MTGHSGQCSNTLVCLVEQRHHPCLLSPYYCQAEVLNGSKGIDCPGRGRRAMNDAEIFIWVPPQGALIVQDYDSLILQVFIRKFKEGEHYN